jgi:hypothetical protein
MKRHTRSILEEINGLVPTRSRREVIASRADHVINSAIHLIELLRENYEPTVAQDLERKLLNAIKLQEANKFKNSLRRAESLVLESQPTEDIQAGDTFFLEFDDTLIETVVLEVSNNDVVIDVDDAALSIISEHATLVEAEYQGRKVSLGKPFLTPDGPAKRSVYVKNKKGNVIKVNFGDKNMRIKKSDPGRRKNFRARHRCDTAKDRTTARYWSCRHW